MRVPKVISELMVSIEGPVEEYKGNLALLIPLEEGGAELAPYAEKISKIEDGCLVVVIKPFLAEGLRIELGSKVIVDNLEGKFRITRSESNDDPKPSSN